MSNNGINSATNGRSGSTSSGSANINLKTKPTATAANATNAATTTTSISQKNDATKTFANATNKATSATANSKTLPTALATTTTTTGVTATATSAATNVKVNHNNGNNICRINNKTTTTTNATATATATGIAAGATHRRENSQLGGGQKDVRKFQYGRPQTHIQQILYTNETREQQMQQQSVESKSEDALVYYDGKLISGSLDMLIEHMVPTHDYYPDHNYIFAFLLSARLFIRPHELLEKISQTWELQQQQQQSEDVVDDAAAASLHYGHMNSSLIAPNSASPLTQRKVNANATSAELEPKPQQRTAIQKSAQNCIHLLSEWIATFPYDFRDERLMQQVRILARKCVYIDNSLGKQVSRILQLLVARLTALEQYEEFLQTLHAANVDLNPNGSNSSHSNNHGHGGGGTLFHPLFGTSAAASYTNSNSSSSDSHKNTSSSNSSGGSNSASSTPQPDDVFGIMDICSSCAYLAHQLTAIELERLSHIGPEEFVQAFAKEYQHSVTTSTGAAGSASHVMSSSLNDMKKTRNLESYVEWFNRLSYLTATEIVKYPKKKQRVRVIEYWIETARECFNIGNFNSLMAIIAGLNLAPISRLKKTWSKVQSAKFSVLEHQMDPTSNFNSYRSTLKAAMWRSEGATDERERIIIPFFSLFVKDLYFLNEGCSNRLPNNHINFEKCSQLAKQVMEFNEWKKVTCPFDKLPNVIAYLQHNTVLNENTLSMASFECEPPENHEEKDRYKTVKAETKQQLLQQLQEQQLQQQQQQQ